MNILTFDIVEWFHLLDFDFTSKNKTERLSITKRLETVMLSRNHKVDCFAVTLGIYAIICYCYAVVFRKPFEKDYIQLEFFRCYFSNSKLLYWDCLYNILFFIPIGALATLVTNKFRLLKALFFGLFLSETIECSQLIWHKGVFDVDDLFNNTLGAFLGGLIIVVVMWIIKIDNNEYTDIRR